MMDELFNVFTTEYPELVHDDNMDRLMFPYTTQCVDIHEPLDGYYLLNNGRVFCTIGRVKTEYDEGTWYRGFYFHWKTTDGVEGFKSFVDGLYKQVEQILEIQKERRRRAEDRRKAEAIERRKKRLPIPTLVNIADFIGMQPTGRLANLIQQYTEASDPERADLIYQRITNTILSTIAKRTFFEGSVEFKLPMDDVKTEVTNDGSGHI